MESSPLTYLRDYFQKFSKDVEEGLNFLEWLSGQNLDLSEPSVVWKENLFRIVFGGYDPLTLGGSLAKGGRFNVGGAQISSFFPNLSMQACLYGATTLECARKEAGEFIMHAEEYLLTPKKSFQLWDLELLLSQKFLYPNLKETVDSTPLGARWELQKIPKISQILASFLRERGGDGLIYPSTKDRSAKIVALFAKDDLDSKKMLHTSRIKS